MIIHVIYRINMYIYIMHMDIHIYMNSKAVAVSRDYMHESVYTHTHIATHTPST